MSWVSYLIGFLAIPAAVVVALLAGLAFDLVTRAIRARRKKPASEMVHGLCRAAGEQDRSISQRFILRWRLPGKRQYQLMLFKEGPNEPTEKFFWPREPELLDDEAS
jgi:hypothetical protein